MPRIALLQMNSGIDPEANFSAIEKAMKEARSGGARMLFTPEMALLLDRDRRRSSATLADPAYGAFDERFQALASEVGIDLALGSMPVPVSDGGLANRSCYFYADARPPVRYDKIHMFDVELSTGESWKESAAYRAGREAMAASDTPVGTLGMTVCYDLRFPALFEILGRLRCDAIAIPAAFTKPTGRAHWHVLQRARAIESSAFVVAAAQVGKHEDGRETYGHSLVVDPWGEVLLDMGGEEAGLGFCDVDLNRIAEVRRQLPSLANRREIAK